VGARQPDGTSVRIRLPAPTVGKPVLDLENSYVGDHDEGFTNRFRGRTSSGRPSSRRSSR
jgi:hypothetical protein